MIIISPYKDRDNWLESIARDIDNPNQEGLPFSFLWYLEDIEIMKRYFNCISADVDSDEENLDHNKTVSFHSMS